MEFILKMQKIYKRMQKFVKIWENMSKSPEIINKIQKKTFFKLSLKQHSPLYWIYDYIFFSQMCRFIFLSSKFNFAIQDFVCVSSHCCLYEYFLVLQKFFSSFAMFFFGDFSCMMKKVFAVQFSSFSRI